MHAVLGALAGTCTGTGCGLGGYTGWVIPAIPSYRAEEPTPASPSEAGPGRPAGPGVGGEMRAGVGGPCTTLRARSGPPVAPPCTGPLDARLLANKARIDLILLKVSHFRVVSARSVEKACHSPHFQNEARNSPLEILGFPYSVAFSHKELMGLF